MIPPAIIDLRKRSSSSAFNELNRSAPLSQPVRRRLSTTDSPAGAAEAGDVFHDVLASASCSLTSQFAPGDGPWPPVLLSRDSSPKNVAQHLERRFKLEADLAAQFLQSFQSFIAEEANLRRLLLPMLAVGKNGTTHSCDSLARVLLSVGQMQSTVAASLLEKLPEYVGELESDILVPLPALMESIPRLILSQFRWLEFLVDSRTLTEKLLEVLSICPLGLKKEIITFLPEVVVDADHEMVVQSLEAMLQEDLQLIVPVLDAFSNLNLEEGLFQQVVSLALSSLRSADVEDLPLVVKFLLQSATGTNVRLVVQQLRENLHFMTIADVRATKPDQKMKGKSAATNCEALVLEAIRSGIRFQNLILEATLKEIRGVEGERNHKVVDIWLLLIIHANGGPHRKTAEQLLLKKVIRGDIGESLLRQCIQGRGDSLQDYFQTLISISEASFRSREVPARQFGVKAYVLLFREFVDPYYRQEVLGALISHTGSGNSHEIGSALETLQLFATDYAHHLLPVSSFINGVLDHLEGFQNNHLHLVYQIFSHLAVFAWTSGGVSSGSSVGSELLIIVRKQITNTEPKYKRMGIIGAVGLASCLSKGTGRDVQDGNLQGSSTEETLSLLQTTLEACKTSSQYRGFFYDELTAHVEATPLRSYLLDWISKHNNAFEGLYLGDLDGGELQTPHDFGVLEGELWMNLDDDMSPIVVNVLPMLIKEDQRSSQALIYLPAYVRLLAAVETVVKDEGLGSIDALLGCPLLLPKHQLLIGESWKQLSRHQKELGCLALFYAINWFRELVNREVNANFTQSTRNDAIVKLFNRLRNLMFLEHCLEWCLESTKVAFPPLHFFVDGPTQLKPEPPKSQAAAQDARKPRAGKREKKLSAKNKKGADTNNSQEAAPASGQHTIIDAFKKSTGAQRSTPADRGENPAPSGSSAATLTTEDREPRGEGLDEQKWKFRPLTLSSLNMLTEHKRLVEPCCLDPHAELPLFLYLLQDLRLKLDTCLDSPRKLAPWMNAPALPKAPTGLGGMSGIVVLTKLMPLYPSLRKHLDCSISVLQSDVSRSQQVEGTQPCVDHWVKQSIAAGNFEDETFASSPTKTAASLFLVMIRCFSKIFSYPDLSLPANSTLLRDILLAFGHGESMGSDLVPPPTPGSLEEAFCHTYNYLDSLADAAATSSFVISTELVMVLKALVTCTQACTDKSKDELRSLRSVEIVPYLSSRLSVSAGRVLRHDWTADDWKNKGDVLRQLLRMQIQNSDSPIELLEELVCSVMPQVPSKGAIHGSVDGYPALSSGTFLIWYRVEHEEVLSLLDKVVRDFLAHSKSKALVSDEVVAKLLASAQQCITLHVSLVNLTKSHDKTTVHAFAVKCGGKFVDTFLKGMDFLKSHYDAHKETINALVKELQKATRIVQTLCADAKGQKRMPVTCKVPAVKRSMERYVYCIKALLHGTSHGSSFWMGNLKHKDLQGREISSQPYAADEDEQFEKQGSDNDQEEPQQV